MLESFSEEKLTICIIDEILKGTNTKERIAASKAILDYMQRQNCLVMVASHDYELTVLLEGTYENYHLQSGSERMIFILITGCIREL